MELWVSNFEDYVNKILLLDEETCNALKKINKKIIAFEFINTKIKLYITPSENGLSIDSKCNKDPDVLIKSSPTNFLKTILPSKYGMAVRSKFSISTKRLSECIHSGWALEYPTENKRKI